jgi:predicted ATPase
MLTKVAAQNFKAFGESPGLTLSLLPFNLFLGQNNSGKTSALDVVALFVQTARERSGQTGLVWSGKLVDLGTTGEHATHRGSPSGVLSIAVEMQTPRTLLEFARQLLSESDLPAKTIGYRVSLDQTVNRYEYEFLVDGEVLVSNRLKDAPGGGNQAELDIPGFPPRSPGERFVPATTQANIFDPNLFSPGNPVPGVAKSRLLIAKTGLQTIRDVLSTRVFLLGPNRGIQKRDLTDAVTILDVGRNGEHTLQVLSTVFAKSEHATAAAKIRQWSDTFGLSSVAGGWAGGQELHSGYLDRLTSTPLPLRSAGFGSQQILPIIVQLFASPEDSVVIVEEPEISLHPAAQVQLVRMFAEAAATGRQVIVTTHSQYLAMALQEEANRSIRPTDIRVYHFSRTQDVSTASGLEVDEKGVLRGWIPSFAAVEQELLQSWMSKVHDELKRD